MRFRSTACGRSFHCRTISRHCLGRKPPCSGVITLRDRLLPLVSLRALLGMAAEGGLGPRGKVVVVSLGDGAVGVVVDATREILRVDPEHHRSGAGLAHPRRR